MQIITGSFEATSEKGQVSSLLYLPEQPRCLLGLAHGAGAGMKHDNLEAIAQALASVGVATFRYQFAYMENGKGREAASISIETVRSAAAAAKAAQPQLPLLMGGHSYGGRMTSLAAARAPLPDVKGLIFFNFPLHAPGKPSKARATHLPQIELPMLFLSGSRDTFAQSQLLEEALEPLGNKANLFWLETANHSYKVLKKTRTKKVDVFTEMAGAVDDWINQTI